LLLLSVIVSQQLWLWTIIPPDTASDTLLLYALSTLNFVAFVVFSFIFVRNLLKLRRERRERQLGSKIKTRLLVYFIAISFLPIIAMATFSYLFLNRSLEKWFGRLPARVVNEVQREAVDAQTRNLHETAALLASVLYPLSDTERQQTLDRVIASRQLSAAQIVDSNSRVVSQSLGQLTTSESSDVALLLERARSQSPDELLADGKDFEVVVVPLDDRQTPGLQAPGVQASAGQQLIVVPLRRAVSDLSGTLTGPEGEYRKLVERQRRVRLLGLSTLGLMTLMLLFVSSWVATYLARGIATPIKALAEASKEIARGNLSHRVSTIAEDELALLADSFNQMTTQLEDNRSSIEAGSAELRDKNLALAERRNYIETILESLSTGVISLDEDDHVTTINAAAARILRLPGQPNGPTKLAELSGDEDMLAIDRVLRRTRRTGQASEQIQLSFGREVPIPIAVTASALRSSTGERAGVVLVLEDLSELLAAQRAAAWSEVAQRMAHEIKNPLTPIQLSAERIAKTYQRLNESKTNGDGAEDKAHVATVINECTQTIRREVAGLKAMVDEFSHFARLPEASLQAVDLNEVIQQAVALYEGRSNGAVFEVQLQSLPATMLDAGHLRRVFVNLIDNSLEALVGSDDRRITITTRHDAFRALIVAEVSDTGQGILKGDFARLFQPYFSTRARGTGLGLAIVQRIIVDHGGLIRAESNSPRGASFVIELPVSMA
jgi:nitrogen fixation/metabolism regulation signal transduction histidine kinase